MKHDLGFLDYVRNLPAEHQAEEYRAALTRAAIAGIDLSWLEGELPKIGLDANGLKKPESVENDENTLGRIRSAISSRQEKLVQAAERAEFEKHLSLEDRRTKLRQLVTEFHKAYSEPLKAIEQGRSTGYALDGENMRCSMFGALYRMPYQQDAKVVTETVKLFWNEQAFGEDLLYAFEASANRLSYISNMTHVYVDAEEMMAQEDLLPPHAVILKEDMFLEVERYSLRNMAAEAQEIVRFARPLAGKHI